MSFVEKLKDAVNNYIDSNALLDLQYQVSWWAGAQRAGRLDRQGIASGRLGI